MELNWDQLPEKKKRQYYFPFFRLEVSLEIKAQIVMIPKAGDTGKNTRHGKS